MSTIRTLLVAAIVTGCGQSGESPSKNPSTREPLGKLAGIWPEKWTCDQIATADQIGTLLGGAAKTIDTTFPTPPGVPKPCNFLVQGATGEEAWTFDLDCRSDYKDRADELFAQYAQKSAEQIEQYKITSDAAYQYVPMDSTYRPGQQPDAAGPRRAPEAAYEVAVGARGLDHRGQGLLFIDDDAPCYVRVVGPDAPRRLALAQYVVAHLTFLNAPMTPRAAP